MTVTDARATGAAIQTAAVQSRRGPQAERSFGEGTRILAIGIASTGVFTFAYLATASHLLSRDQYSRLAICWSIIFVIASVIYRPVEQLLSRTISDRRARGRASHGRLSVPIALQAVAASAFLVGAISQRTELQDRLFGGSLMLYWVFVTAVVAYAGSYFARGWFAGHKWFGLYGALVLVESTTRLLFAVAVAFGIAHGFDTIAIGMAAAPLVSLCVLPFALHRTGAPGQADRPAGAAGEDVGAVGDETGADLSVRSGSRFAAAVLAVMLSEQTLMNAGVIVVAVGAGFDLASGLTGFVFNVLLIVRAPLQLFQAVQTSILPHLTSLQARASIGEFRRTVRVTVVAALGFGIAVALGLILIGPAVMRVVVGDHGFAYGRFGLALVGIGMGLHLTSCTLNQALLARSRPWLAALCWLLSATAFVAFLLIPAVPGQVFRTEVGYCGATGLLALLLLTLYRRTSPAESATTGVS